MGSIDNVRRRADDETLSDLPPELSKEMETLHDMFTVDTKKLKAISKSFQQALEEGLSGKGGDIPMNITWVLGFPSGDEQGSYLTLDLGGTNLRVCWVTLLDEKGRQDVKQAQYKLDSSIKKGNAEKLWAFLAETLEKFLDDQNLKGDEDSPIPLGFTFSYPATQDYIDHGILQRWTKGLEIQGVEGNDAAQQLRDAIKSRNLPIKLVALINDTTGAMIASAYSDPATIIGAIFGTGCNAAYMEHISSIPKLSTSLSPETPMAINCEYGAFDNSHQILPRTKYDEQIDQQSPKPGEQTFEKMSAGLYLGELFRLVMLDLHSKSLVFRGQDISRLKEPYILDTSFLSTVEDDASDALQLATDLFKSKLNITPTPDELLISRFIADLIATRAARLCTTGIAAICRKKNVSTGHVAADGSVVTKHPKFKLRWARAMGEILDWPSLAERGTLEDPIQLVRAEDGSGVGAAVISAMTVERARRGERTGIRQEF